MDLKLAGKTALITGASKGIGGATAAQLAAEGCHLVLVARTAGDLARAKESIARKTNVSVETVPADLSDSGRTTDSLRGAGDQGGLTGELEVHDNVLGNARSERSGRTEL